MDSFPHQETLFAQVLLPLNLQQLYTYRVPSELNSSIEIGQRVVVPFGKNKVYSGIVYQLDNKPPLRYEAKYILELLDDEPIADESQLSFWSWISSYYMCSLGQVMAAGLPAGLKLEGESVVIKNPDFEVNSTELDAQEQEILLVLDHQPDIKISKLADIIRKKGIHKYLKSLYLKNAIYLKEDIESPYKPKLEKYLRISAAYIGDEALTKLFNELEKRAPRQLDVLMRLVSGSGSHKWHGYKELLRSGLSSPSIKALLDKGLIEMEERQVSRLEQFDYPEKAYQLNEDQSRAKQEIISGFRASKPVLLHGITSSGKTLVYIDLIKEFLQKGEQVLYLLPEIALTSQLLDRLAIHFGEQLLVSHSKFSNNERVEVYNKVRSGEPLVILGTRSALFQPFQNLGLIVVDEEHENSFKQFEPAPRFHARDAAVYLAHQQKAAILLGSATPAMESYYNAIQGKYHLVEMSRRYKDAQLPEVEFIDMQLQRKQKRNKGIYSDLLLDAIKSNAEAGMQSILFQNKKGYVPILECTICSWTPKCVNCDISLTYYKFQNNLRCHYCGYTREPVTQCAACGNLSLELVGYGTERIEDELNLYLPNLKAQRLDYDSTRTKTSHKKIIDRFEKGEIDVLIGTQMVTKGLDFDRVNLVAVMNADHLLNFPDFRAYERSFQLITQVAGRAGRREQQGKVYIQTAVPGNPVLEHIKTTDFKGFYETEIAEREHFQYPPFTRLIKVTLKHKDALELHKAGQKAKDIFSSSFGNRMLGPEKPHISKIRNMYLLNFLLKLENNNQVLRQAKRDLLKAVLQIHQIRDFKALKTVIDVDPL